MCMCVCVVCVCVLCRISIGTYILCVGVNNMSRLHLFVLSSVQVGVGELALQVGALEAKLSQVRTTYCLVVHKA